MFKTTFTPTSAELSSPHLDLVLDGLDTFAEVFLVRVFLFFIILYMRYNDCLSMEQNGTSILKTTNMFISNRVDVKKVVKKGENELRIEFDSAWARGKQEEKENGGKRPLCSFVFRTTLALPFSVEVAVKAEIVDFWLAS